jgi:hypothetical protein
MKIMSGLVMALTAAIILFPLCARVNAESPERESAITAMKKGAQQMIEGGKLLQQKRDPSSAEKMIKDGHRMMMNAEKDLVRAQNALMKQGAKMMLDGLQVLKTRKDAGEAERLMARGQEIILEADKMMADTRPEKMMQGSRTLMRGLRMRHEPDLKTADKLVKEGQDMMKDAAHDGNDRAAP